MGGAHQTGDGDAEVRAAVGRARSAAAYLLTVVWGHHSNREMRGPPLCVPALEATEMAALAAKGSAICDMPVEEAGFELGCFYTSRLPAAFRSRYGVYYTPPAIVARLLARLTAAGHDWSTGSVLDPACGGAAFLAPCAQRMWQARLGAGDTSPERILTWVEGHLRGFEIDPFSAWMSQVLLELALGELCEAAGRDLDTVISIGDSLDFGLDWDGQFDLVVGNPPFGKVRLAPERRTAYARGLFGHANLYGLFTDLGVRLVREGGLLAYVTPPSFLGGQYFKALRRVLMNECPPRYVDFVTDRKGLFSGVLQETCLTIYRKGGQRTRVSVSMVQPETGNGALVANSMGDHVLPDTEDAPWMLPRTPEQSRVLSGAAALPTRLADLGYAVETGKLVWNRHKDQLRARAGCGNTPIVWAESVRPDGTFELLCTQENRRPYIRLRPGQDHLRTDQGCVLIQRTTAVEQPRRIVAAMVPAELLLAHGGFVVENHLNMLLAVRPGAGRLLPVVSRLLNSAAADSLFRCISGSVAVSAYELLSLPMPSQRQLEALAALAGVPGRFEEEVNRIYGASA